MIQTFADREHVVQAMRLTGTESSARALCRWLETSQWNIYTVGDGTYGVRIPAMYTDDNIGFKAVKGCWVVRNSNHNVFVLTDSEMKKTYERI